MLKKLLAVVAVLSVLFCFAGCTDDVKDGVDAATDALLSKNIDKADILGLWEGEGKMSEMMTAAEQSGDTDELGETASGIIEVLSQIESDEECNVYLKFNEDNTYDIMYEIESYVEAIKEYYRDVYAVLRTDKELLKKFLGVDDATLDTIISSSNFTSFTQLVDLLEQNTANLPEKDFLESLTSVLPSAVVEEKYIVEKGYSYKIDGKYIKIQLTKDSEETNDMILKDGKLVFTKFTGLAKNPNAVVFKNGFEKVEND